MYSVKPISYFFNMSQEIQNGLYRQNYFILKEACMLKIFKFEISINIEKKNTFIFKYIIISVFLSYTFSTTTINYFYL